MSRQKQSALAATTIAEPLKWGINIWSMFTLSHILVIFILHTKQAISKVENYFSFHPNSEYLISKHLFFSSFFFYTLQLIKVKLSVCRKKIRKKSFRVEKCRIPGYRLLLLLHVTLGVHGCVKPPRIGDDRLTAFRSSTIFVQ